MRYLSLGDLPAKRHAQTFRGPQLLVEEVLGYEGFSGNESILYHLGSPCRVADVGELVATQRVEWVPETHVHRLADFNSVPAGGDPVSGRQLMMFNSDIEVSVCKPRDSQSGFHRCGDGDEVLYIHRGGGVLRSVFGSVAFRERDYLVIPRGTTYRLEPDFSSEQFWLVFHTPGEIETPKRYRNRYGQLLEHAPFSQRDFHGPASLETVDASGSYELTVRVRGGIQHYTLDRHPFDVVAWDGYVFPYTFNADDFEPRAGRFHLPPPAHQTFEGPNFVICTFAPRMLDWDPTAVTLPYHHSNIQSEEVMFYAAGDYAARKGVDVGAVTLHPSGLPHGPQPGAVEAALGKTSTDELAVMWDTFAPLKLTPLWQQHDKPDYAYSWNPAHLHAQQRRDRVRDVLALVGDLAVAELLRANAVARQPGRELVVALEAVSPAVRPPAVELDRHGRIVVEAVQCPRPVDDLRPRDGQPEVVDDLQVQRGRLRPDLRHGDRIEALDELAEIPMAFDAVAARRVDGMRVEDLLLFGRVEHQLQLARAQLRCEVGDRPRERRHGDPVDHRDVTRRQTSRPADAGSRALHVMRDHDRDRPVPRPPHTVQVPCGVQRQRGLRSCCQHRRHELALLCEPRVSHRVHARDGHAPRVTAHPVTGPRLRNAARQQLPARDDTVLTPDERRQPCVKGDAATPRDRPGLRRWAESTAPDAVDPPHL